MVARLKFAELAVGEKFFDPKSGDNSAGVYIKHRYVSRHLFMNQYVYDYDVCDVTIARGLNES